MSNDPAFDNDVWEMGLQAATDRQRAQHGGEAPDAEQPPEWVPAEAVTERVTQLPEAPCSVTARVDFHGAKDVLLTFRGYDGRTTLEQLSRALDWIRAQEGTAPATMPVYSTAPAQPAPAAAPAHGMALVCPHHGTTLKQSKHREGEWFCPTKISDDDGTGKAAYCRYKAKV
jgi:hypothetical protein